MPVSKKTPQSAFAIMQRERKLEIARNSKTKGMNDHELMLQISVYKGNIKQMCEDHEISYSDVRNRIKKNPALAEVVKSNKLRTIEDMWYMYSNGILTGRLTAWKTDKNGVMQKVEQEVDSNTRMYHMNKTLMASGESLGIKDVQKEEPKIGVQINNQFNVIDEEKKAAILKLAEIFEGSESSDELVESSNLMDINNEE